MIDTDSEDYKAGHSDAMKGSTKVVTWSARLPDNETDFIEFTVLGDPTDENAIKIAKAGMQAYALVPIRGLIVEVE